VSSSSTSDQGKVCTYPLGLLGEGGETRKDKKQKKRTYQLTTEKTTNSLGGLREEGPERRYAKHKDQEMVVVQKQETGMGERVLLGNKKGNKA
jgi:hypothetical protein